MDNEEYNTKAKVVALIVGGAFCYLGYKKFRKAVSDVRFEQQIARERIYEDLEHRKAAIEGATKATLSELRNKDRDVPSAQELANKLKFYEIVYTSYYE